MTDRIRSENGYELVVQPDGNLVLYNPDGTPRWASHTFTPAPPEVPAPQPPPAVLPARPEGVGVSYYTAMTDRACDPDRFAQTLADLGVRHTRVWALDAWANGVLDGGTGCYHGYQPWKLVPGRSVFDLEAWNQAYFDRVATFCDAMNARGIHVVISLLELYTWSKAKSDLLWVPDRDKQPVRNNVNDVRWGDPNDDDGGFFWLPDRTMMGLIELLVSRTLNSSVSFEIGNEMPEKALHHRMVDALLDYAIPREHVQVNRNEDTPSQYDNMRIGHDFGRIAFHGFEHLSYLDTDYGPDQHRFRTFREAWDSGECDPARVVLSSDGVGRNTAPYYDEDALVAVVADATARGFAYEHQARELKLGRFLHGRFDLHDLNQALIARMVAA